MLCMLAPLMHQILQRTAQAGRTARTKAMHPAQVHLSYMHGHTMQVKQLAVTDSAYHTCSHGWPVMHACSPL